MPFSPVTVLDPERLKIAANTLCTVFNIPSLHPHQEEAGQNILRGHSTFLDVPTGGGKTIAFWYPLFYHWQPGNIAENCQKIVLVIGPLVALLEAQAKTLNEKGIPAAAITSKTQNLDQILADLGNNKFRVGFVGPEMALSSPFHAKVLNNPLFTKNIIALVIDEAHCICEWGGDDFRPEYRKIVQLAARLPTGTPILAATATAPRDVIKDIIGYLGLPEDTARVEVSNEKLNVSLVVRILQEEPESFADLIVMFPDSFGRPEDFDQSLFYVNGRQDAEKMQDFLRDNTPEGIDSKIFEFYHKDIEDARKIHIQNGLNNGTIRGVPATDALGLGMDFRAILRIILWMRPRTFLSLVQKIGRCVRDHSKRGVAVLYITKAMYTRCCIELDKMRREDDESSESEAEEEPEDAEGDDEQQEDRDVAVAAEESESDDEEVVPAPKRRKFAQKKLSPLERRDLRYLLEYIVTEECRRIPWNKFFGNKEKKKLQFPVPPGPCCDNCDPESFEVDNIVLTGGQNLRTGRREGSSEELEAAVREKLKIVRNQILADVYPNQHFLTGNIILADTVVDALAKRARLVTSVESLLQQTRWGQAARFGDTVVKAIQEVVALFPDHAKAAREQEEAERAQRKLDAAAAKELRKRLVLVFDGCYNAVFSQREPVAPSLRKTKKPKEPRQICRQFLQLPKSNRYPLYYAVIKNPISMLRIKTWSQKPTHYETLKEYRDDWHLLFNNARAFNMPDSQIYQDAEYLQKVFDNQLYLLSNLHNLPNCDELPCTFNLLIISLIHS
ncbi:p-loop containing nucleoside triphosphate hydrolase protein [Favolaschia claudopus]|uniref:DNA 3'-5' helicase n=1 Tax=Favolaschia claudopus TaxID=2862362 RepID=A0AAW0BX30_9AGAR